MSCTGGTLADCYAAAWAARVVYNGGAKPAQATIDAAATFYNALETAGILTKMVAVNLFVPDSLAAAITPFIKGPGLDPWTNTAFVSGDVSVNGLTGNGSTKRLNTGLNPKTHFDYHSAGITAYCPTNPTPSGAFSGFNKSGDTCEFALWKDGGNRRWEAWRYNDATSVIVASAHVGYYSGNRTSNVLSTLYIANGAVPHAVLGTAVGDVDLTADARPNEANQPAFCFQFDAGGGNNNYIAGALSFLAFHEGLTEAESLALYNAVQAFRIIVGGGYIAYPANDTMESYSNGDSLNGLDGGTEGDQVTWTAYVARNSFKDILAEDDFESYADGAAVAGLNGGSGAWNGSYAT